MIAPDAETARCDASWVPREGGPGHQCVLPAGHEGLHDSAPPSVPAGSALSEPVTVGIDLVTPRGGSRHEIRETHTTLDLCDRCAGDVFMFAQGKYEADR